MVLESLIKNTVEVRIHVNTLVKVTCEDMHALLVIKSELQNVLDRTKLLFPTHIHRKWGQVDVVPSDYLIALYSTEDKCNA